LSEDRGDAMRVVTTGATGFIGRHVTAALLAQGNPVTALVRDVERARRLQLAQGADFIEFDLAQAQLPLAARDASALIHCAWGDVRDHGSIRHVEEHAANSYRFIKSAIASGVAKVIVTGTSWEYGEVYGPVCASTTPRPKTLYGIGKHLLHQMLRGLQQHMKFDLVWARLFYMYGDGDDPRSLIALFDRALDSAERVFNMSLGEQLHDFLPVDDGAKRLAWLLDAPDGVYNVCSGQPISLRRLLEQRMREKNRTIELNLGYYPYRKQDSMALWGADPVMPSACDSADAPVQFAFNRASSSNSAVR
jgi:nucleoside-diphosphate-sugar epimerase